MTLFPSMPRLGANVAANYTKRMADQHLWDKLIATPLGRWLKSLPSSGKYSAEAVMYLADSIVKHQIGDSTPLRLFLNEVLGDAGPEMAKRILNGSAGSPQAGSAGSPQAGSAGSPQAGSAGSPQAGAAGSPQAGESGPAEERDPAAELLAMDAAEREALLAYYRELPPAQQERFEHVWANHLATQLSAFISMSREGRDTFLKLMAPDGRPPLTDRTAAIVNRFTEFVFPW